MTGTSVPAASDAAAQAPILVARANNFHLLRYVLAACVLYSHSYGLLALPEPLVFQSTMGTFAVQGFFALSGYLIAKSCLRTNHLGHFFVNRFLRLIPALAVALAVSFYFHGVFDRFEHNPLPYVANGPLWTLTWEVMCYALCALLWRLGLLAKGSAGPLLAAAWLVFAINPSTSDAGLVIAPLFLLFFTGSFIAVEEQNLRLDTLGWILAIPLACVLIEPTGSTLIALINPIPFLYGPGWPEAHYPRLIYLLALPFTLIWLARYFRWSLPLKNDYSYGLYIFGWPVQQITIALFPTIQPMLLFFVAMAITHGIAMISWHLLEKRALRLKF